ncbi:MAG: hypothetical protein ABIY70_26355, partial [Capsulimonas sp.]|uniref:hypothetical protein n=1 Tax=Capsulimonas sp. TaxID=2494211 RepID=UPI003263BAC2
VAPAPKITLADAVAQATLSKGVLIFTTYPSRTLLPSTAPPSPGDTVSQIASSFGLVKTEIGSVTALVFPTMTVFNDSPDGAEIYADMPPRQIIVLLAATLDQDQWSLLTSKGGIADSDLTTDEQHAMWAALWTGRNFTYYTGGVGNKVGSEEIKRVRLRLGSSVRMRLYNKHDKVLSLTNEDIAENNPWERDRLAASPPAPDGRRQKALPSMEAPSAAKASDIDFTDDRLRTPIDVSGVKTVGALVDLIRTRTGMEIYADRRMEAWPLLLAGDMSAKPAGNLLRALALTVAGVYRKVGTAYVLTADLVGAGARTQMWKDFQRDIEKLRDKPVNAASGIILSNHGDADLPSFDNALALSAEQFSAHKPIANLGHIEVPFEELTATQKAAARRMAVDLVKAQSQPGQPYEADLAQKIVLEDEIVVCAILPIHDKPLEIREFSPTRYELFRPPVEASMDEMRKMFLSQKAAQDVKRDADASVHLQALIPQVRRRALLASPKSARETEGLLASMETVGFNELWLMTFAEGEEQRDLLDAVVPMAKQKGIAVYPVMSIFHWGASASKDARDVTILGENSLRSNERWRARSVEDMAMLQQFKKLRDETGALFPIPNFGYSDMVVSPFSEVTRTALTNAVGDIAAAPGIAGIVWQDTLPPGYDTVSRTFDEEFYAHMGYTLPARLAFLRKWRVDPIDIIEQQSQDRVWPDWMQASYAETTDFSKKWRSFLFESNVAFLRELYDNAQAKSQGSRLPILVRQQREYGMEEDISAHWFSDWDAQAGPPPALAKPEDNPTTANALPAPVNQATPQSKTSLLVVTPQTLFGSATLQLLLGDAVKDMAAGKSSWQGFVVDVTQLHNDNPLAKIAAEIASPPAK